MNKSLKFDWIASIAVFLLVVIGLVFLYGIFSNDPQANFFSLGSFQKQLVAVFLGIIAMVFLASYDYRLFNTFSTKLYFIMLVVLLGVVFFGSTVRGTTGWIKIGPFNFQPVEIAKVVMVVFLASFLAQKRTQLSVLARIMGSIVLLAIPVFLILKQPDFGSSMVIVGSWAGMLVASGITKKDFFVLCLIGMLTAFSGYFFLKDYQVQRLQNFVNPYNDPKGSGYNVIQSIVAVGSGGVFGKGLGHGSQGQLNFLPEKHTDFIFALIAEETGLIGSGLVLFLFGLLMYRFKETARLARDNFGHLLMVGMMCMFFIQILVNVGMNLGIAPVAGVPLPFLSYGGSSMIASFMAFGIIQSVYIRRLKNLD